MPATFFSLSSKDIFQSGGNGAHLVNIPAVDSIVGANGLAVYDNVSIQLGETIQYFLTFDDIIKFIHFGKGVGAITVEGTMYSDCSGNVPGVYAFAEAIAATRGRPQYLTVGSVTVTAILTNSQMSITSQPDTMGHFVFNYAVVDHAL